MELELTKRRLIKIWIAYSWRNFIAIVLGMILGGILGSGLAMILGLFEISNLNIQIISALFGVIIGFIISLIPFKIVLAKDFGEFRIGLIKNEKKE